MEFRPVDGSALTALLQQSRLSWLPKYRIISADFSKGDECIEIINTDKFHDHGGFLPRTSAAALLQLLSTGYEVKYDERSRYRKIEYTDGETFVALRQYAHRHRWQGDPSITRLAIWSQARRTAYTAASDMRKVLKEHYVYLHCHCANCKERLRELLEGERKMKKKKKEKQTRVRTRRVTRNMDQEPLPPKRMRK